MSEKVKITVYSNLLYAVFFGAFLSATGGLFVDGTIDLRGFPLMFFVSTGIGFIMGMLIPSGKISGTIASKVAQPGTFLFRLVMYSVLMVIILIYMCPLMTIIKGCLIMGTPLKALIPSMYSLFVPFFILCTAALMIVGDPIMNLAKRLAAK